MLSMLGPHSQHILYIIAYNIFLFFSTFFISLYTKPNKLECLFLDEPFQPSFGNKARAYPSGAPYRCYPLKVG